MALSQKANVVMFDTCENPFNGNGNAYLMPTNAVNLDTIIRKQPTKGLDRTIVTPASPPATEATVVASQPLTKEDLIGYLKSGCKPKDLWRIGTEHEKFGVEMDTLSPVSYEKIAKLLNGIAERYGWEKETEAGKIIGLKQGNKSITLEAGGQLELSGAPLETLHKTCDENISHFYQLKKVAKELGIKFLAIGFQPKHQSEDIPVMPKTRYDVMRSYMPQVGSEGLDMLLRTCSVQVNLDFGSEADMIRKFRASIALQPIATALFANSPFKDGKPTGLLSTRSNTWRNCDDSRTGMIPFIFDDSFGFERYVDYALDVPMFFAYRNKKYVDCAGMSFRDFMKGKLPALPGQFPTLDDWETHLGTLYPEARLKRYIEMRGADAGPLWTLNALPAFWVGLLYDEVSLQSALDMIADWTDEERDMLSNKVPIFGLKTPFRDGSIREVAEYVVKLAKDGLERRGLNEASYLNELEEIARTGVTQAEKLLERYNGVWGCNVDAAFHELLY